MSEMTADQVAYLAKRVEAYGIGDIHRGEWRRIFALVANQDAENDRLRAALAFAASCIKAGEPWTPECERIIDGALKGRTE